MLHLSPFMQSLILTIVVGSIGSGGTGLIVFLIQRHDQKKGASKKLMDMVLGLAHDRIVEVGGAYLERGSVSAQELDDFNKYLYEPYAENGGNGTGKTIHDRVNSLPIVEHEKEEKAYDRSNQ